MSNDNENLSSHNAKKEPSTRGPFQNKPDQGDNENSPEHESTSSDEKIPGDFLSSKEVLFQEREKMGIPAGQQWHTVLDIARAEARDIAKKEAELKMLVSDNRNPSSRDYILPIALVSVAVALFGIALVLLSWGTSPISKSSETIVVLATEAIAGPSTGLGMEPSKYGTDVLTNKDPAGKEPNSAVFSFHATHSGEYMLEIRLAAQEARPIDVSVNGELVIERAGNETTGGWARMDRDWVEAGKVELIRGRNAILLERVGPFPHISGVRLTN